MSGKNDNRSISERMMQKFDLPAAISSRTPCVTVTGSGAVRVMNFRSVVSYRSDGIVLDCRRLVITVSGRELEIRAMCGGEIYIGGVISSVSIGGRENV